MLYVLIPCLILLIVAVILKKRESAKEESNADKGKKATSKKTHKKIPARSNRSLNIEPTAAHTTSQVTAASTSTPLNPDFTHNIEQLIQSKSYFSAEAKINQALNQDNSQHELYLYLLDIHLAQKDEFATKQLINYLRSLGLHELADQAEIKQKNTAPEQEANLSSIFSAPISNVTSSSSSHAAFDALMDQNSAPAPTPQAQPIFDLNLNDKPNADPNDYRAFDYVVEDKVPTQKAQPVELYHSTAETLGSDTLAPVPDANTSIAPSVKVETEKTVDIPPLEFNFDLAPQEQSPAAQIKQEDFSHQALNFDTQAKQETENKTSFEFNLEQPLEIANSEFDFKLDTPVATNRSDFAYDADEFNLAPQVTVEAQTDTDPLVQSFPELISHNEIQLNLDLAKKYIQLGAYAAATRLLNEKADQYSIEQRAQSEKLLNQIAS